MYENFSISRGPGHHSRAPFQRPCVGARASTQGCLGPGEHARRHASLAMPSTPGIPSAPFCSPCYSQHGAGASTPIPSVCRVRALVSSALSALLTRSQTATRAVLLTFNDGQLLYRAGAARNRTNKSHCTTIAGGLAEALRASPVRFLFIPKSVGRWRQVWGRRSICRGPPLTTCPNRQASLLCVFVACTSEYVRYECKTLCVGCQWTWGRET